MKVISNTETVMKPVVVNTGATIVLNEDELRDLTRYLGARTGQGELWLKLSELVKHHDASPQCPG